MELDLSFGVKNLARFRANLFMQRGAVGAVFRVVPFKMPPLAELGLPKSVEELCNRNQRAGPRDRPDRLGQVDDAGVDDRLHQPDPAQATSSPSRIRSSSCTRTRAAWSTSARSGRDTKSCPSGAQAHPAPGPGRRAGRRDARPRDHRGRADDRRDRPPLHSPRCTPTSAIAEHQPHHRRLPAAPAAADPRGAVVRARGRAQPDPDPARGRARAARWRPR